MRLNATTVALSVLSVGLLTLGVIGACRIHRATKASEAARSAFENQHKQAIAHILNAVSRYQFAESERMIREVDDRLYRAAVSTEEMWSDLAECKAHLEGNRSYASEVLASGGRLEGNRLITKSEIDETARRQAFAAVAERERLDAARRARLEREELEANLRQAREESMRPTTVLFEEMEVAVGPAEWRDCVAVRGRGNPELARNRYLCIPITVTNIGRGPDYLNRIMLVDSVGAEYAAEDNYRHEQRLRLGMFEQLNPRDSAAGTVVFDVRQDREYKLLLRGSAFSGNRLEVPIKFLRTAP